VLSLYSALYNICHLLYYLCANVTVLGRGLFATEDIMPGQFLAQYCGELISGEEGDRREAIAETGFRYFFQHHGSYYW